MNVSELVAGRELDALVAEKIMGMVNVRLIQHGQGEDLCGDHDGLTEWVPAYSTDIAAAWQVVEHFWRDHWWIKVSAQHTNSDPGWQCRMDDELERRDPPGVVAHGETAPLAICRAALAASATTMT